MGLTISHGPLATERPAEVNYRIEGPARLLLLDRFPRRVRALLGGETVLDTTRGRLLHESGLLPVLYVPEEDLSTGLLEPTGHTTHCPYKGEAAYWTVRAGDRTAENAVWAYPEPRPEADWLRGHYAVEWEAMEAWYDEDEQVHGHLRDPYHRVDVRRTSRRVRVLRDGQVVADSTRAAVLSETGLPNRYYLPKEDVAAPLEPSPTSMVCPYKGTSSYWSLPDLADAGWSYEQPLEDAVKITGMVAFAHDGLEVRVE